MKRKILLVLGKLCTTLYNRFIGLMQYYDKNKFKAIGHDVRINKNGVFTHENISIGNDVFIGINAIMQAKYSEIIIGNHVAIGPGVNIYGANHDFKSVGTYMSRATLLPKGNIVIEDDVWIGANAIILPDVHIGRGSVIGAGSVVAKDVPPYSIYAGHAVIKQRFTDDEITEHEIILNEKEHEQI